MFCVAILIMVAACTPRSEIIDSENTEEFSLTPVVTEDISEEYESFSDDYFQTLTLRQKLSQLFLINLPGDEVFAPVEFDKNKEPAIPGGYLFFSYNISDTIGGVTAFTSSIRDYCFNQNIIPPFLAIDHEGGPVNRLRKLLPPLPSALEVATTLTLEKAQELYRDQGKELADMGFHLNLAPVVEIETESNTEFLHERSFGNAEQVTRFAAAAVNGYRSGGIQTTLKHFPGNTNDDPHDGLSEISVTPNELEISYIAPFRSLIRTKPAAVLMSFARVAGYDSGIPACLSEFWVGQMLRKNLGFDGIVISDDIYMEALLQNGFSTELVAQRAIEAGVDVIMISEKRFLPLLDVLERRALVDPVFEQKIDKAATRVLLFKNKCGIVF
jgi:beta-N-acetylhexosaminidase